MNYKLFLFSTTLLISSFTYIRGQEAITAKLELKNQASLKDTIPAQFGEGENDLYTFIKSNIVYPSLLVKTEMQGSVTLTFLINEKGRVNNLQIISGFDPLADDEVLRVVRSMPQWTPASVNGNKLAMQQKLTVTFTLNEELIKQAKNNEASSKPSSPKIEPDKIKVEEPVSQISEDTISNSTPPLQADTLLNRAPQYPGGKEAMEAYLKKNMKYPKLGVEYKIEGRVLFNLEISPTGEIKKTMLVKSLFRDCDEEAYFLIKKMPKWIPGLKDGKPASMVVMLPIPFTLPK